MRPRDPGLDRVFREILSAVIRDVPALINVNPQGLFHCSLFHLPSAPFPRRAAVAALTPHIRLLPGLGLPGRDKAHRDEFPVRAAPGLRWMRASS